MTRFLQTRCRLHVAFCCVTLLSTGSLIARAADSVTTQPAAATQPQAAALLQRVNDAYAQLHFAEFDGTVTGHFDVGGQTSTQQESFTSTFAAPNRFRHEAKNDVRVGCTGETAYAYEPVRNVFTQADAPKDRASAGDWPAAVASVLQRQNPSMLLALTSTPDGSSLSDLSDEMTRLPDAVVDGVACPSLQFQVPGQGLITLVVDPQTYLLRQMRVDMRGVLEQRGTTDVKQATVTIDYRTVRTTAPADWAAPAGEALFAWSPPRDATPAGAASPSPLSTQPASTQSADPAELNPAAAALLGRRAPAFILPDLNDKPVSLAAQKGSVVVVNLWATWCGPCVLEMPTFDRLYKEKAGQGLKVFAIDQQEDKPTVQAFVQKRGLHLPMLLDASGDASGQYGSAAGVPDTFVIGKDGVVQRVFVGLVNEGELRTAVEQAMAR